ncbi:MAG: hypothetical protein HFJ60_09055 [Clostridia bacterium]|nr:hypothetical protein [Clostridia bacterium]
MLKIENKSRAEYFRKRREELGSFSVLIDKERLNKIENILKEKKKSKTQWLKEKIDEEKK